MCAYSPNNRGPLKPQIIGVSQQTASSILIEKITIAIASNVARKGQLDKAENIISSIIQTENTGIETVDLLARIYAQQGRIKEAKMLWQKLVQDNPSNNHIQQSIETCDNLLARHNTVVEQDLTHKMIIAVNIIYIIASLIAFTIMVSR